MIRSFTVFTENIDDPQAAAAEIKAQLDAGPGLLKNTVGIIACHYEFVLSGAARAVCENLPFDVAGTISSVQSGGDAQGTLMLTILVITSDELRFKTGMSPSLKDQPNAGIEAAYTALAGDEKPALIFAFAPFMPENYGDEYVNTLSAASGGAPVSVPWRWTIPRISGNVICCSGGCITGTGWP
jgi:hypothetical protein